MKSSKQTRVAIVGASGFLGSHLTQYLLKKTLYSITAISRKGQLPNGTHSDVRLKLVPASVFDELMMTDALEGVDTAFFFVHMMGQTNTDFYSQEALAAERFSSACKTAGVKRVIYMGGLGDDKEDLSRHLLSRHNTGMVLREHLPLVIEFRASMIIGNGSLAYDIIRNLVQKLPVMVLPKWSVSRTQPIALSDALEYLRQSVEINVPHSEIIEIGGRDVLSYAKLYKLYGRWSGKPRPVIRVAIIPKWLGGSWLNIFTPQKHARVGKVMVNSLANAMVVRHPEKAQLYFPAIKPKDLQTAFSETLRRPK